MGNPHAVVFVPDLTKLDLAAVGPQFESHKVFPRKTNTEFVQVGGHADSHLGSRRDWALGAGIRGYVQAV